MGINILACRMTGEITDDGYRVTKGLEEGEWDGVRYGGDREFAFNEGGFDWEYVSEYTKEEQPYTEYYIYMRPKDINKAREWIRENIYENNQKRLLDMMDKMEQDNNIYFWISY